MRQKKAKRSTLDRDQRRAARNQAEALQDARAPWPKKAYASGAIFNTLPRSKAAALLPRKPL